MPVMSEDTNDSNSNDDDSNSCYNWDNEVDVGKEVHDRVLEAFAASALSQVSNQTRLGFLILSPLPQIRPPLTLQLSLNLILSPLVPNNQRIAKCLSCQISWSSNLWL